MCTFRVPTLQGLQSDRATRATLALPSVGPGAESPQACPAWVGGVSTERDILVGGTTPQDTGALCAQDRRPVFRQEAGWAETCWVNTGWGRCWAWRGAPCCRPPGAWQPQGSSRPRGPAPGSSSGGCQVHLSGSGASSLLPWQWDLPWSQVRLLVVT